MGNKYTHWFQHCIIAGKILVVLFTVFTYFHYFNHQSWGYFTIDPKQPLINIYAVSDKGILSKEPALKNNTSYGMGMSREGLVLFNKLANVIASNKSLVWKKVEWDSISSVVSISRNIGVINYNDCNIGKGRFVIIKTERIPFQFVSGKQTRLPAAVYTITDIR